MNYHIFSRHVFTVLALSKFQPLAFIDYETFPSAIPRYSGYRPYQQIPFQFSLHIIKEEGGGVTHCEFLHTKSTNPDEDFIKAMEANLPSAGTILVWSQRFEKGINNQIASRLPQYQKFIEGIQDRVVDLIEPFDGRSIQEYQGLNTKK